MKKGYRDWEKFTGKKIPSSVKLYPIIYKYLKKNYKILDIGCGYGKICIQLALKGHFVEGIDINKSGIEEAKQTAKKLNLTNKLKFRVGDATRLPYPNETFDIAIMQALLTAIVNKEDRNKIMKEAFRVLKPTGYLYLAEFGQTWHSDIYRERYLKDLPITKEEGSFLAYNKETGEVDYIAHHYTEKELVFLLINNGFKIDYFKIEKFTTRSGNKVNGFVIVAIKIPRGERRGGN